LCNSIVASSLQQTTWLRKNFAVKLTPTNPTTTSNLLSNSSAATLAAGGIGTASATNNPVNSAAVAGAQSNSSSSTNNSGASTPGATNDNKSNVLVSTNGIKILETKSDLENGLISHKQKLN
jgi:hypothetical protein